MFRDLTDEDKQVYTQKEKEAKSEYDALLKEFERSADYKKYKAIENRVSGRSAASSKAKAKAKPSGPAPPAAPDNMPKKPAISFFMFRSETRGSPKEVHQKWLDLKAEGQKEWNDKYKGKMAEYEQAMKDFQKTADGKKYLRLKAGFEKNQAQKKAKERYLSGADAPQEPKRPAGSYFLFVNEKRADVQKELGNSQLGPVSQKLTQMWNTIPKEEKEAFEKRAEVAKKEYDRLMQEYKSSDAFKKYDRAMSSINRSKSSKPKPSAKKAKKAAGKGAAKTKGGAAKAAKDSSDSDVMGSDSSNSSSSDSDSD